MLIAVNFTEYGDGVLVCEECQLSQSTFPAVLDVSFNGGSIRSLLRNFLPDITGMKRPTRRVISYTYTVEWISAPQSHFVQVSS